MKQFFIILAAILVAVAIVALIVGVSSAKKQNDQFNQDMQQFDTNAKKALNSN